MSRGRRPAVLAALCLAATGLTACGEQRSDTVARPDYRLVTPPRYRGATAVDLGRRMRRADVVRLKPVLDAWSTAVRRHRLRAATRHFALPTIVYQPSTGPVEIRTAAIADRFNDSFPCGAKLVGARADGRYIVGTFTLVDVPGKTCTTPDQRVRVGFVFGDRRRPNRFTEWWRVPDTPGAETGPATRPTAPVATAATFG